MLLVEVSHVVAESPFELPVGLGMVYRRMNQPDADPVAERGKKVSFEAGTIIKDDRLRNNLPLAHGGDNRVDRGADVRREQEIAKHIAARIVVHKRQVIGRLASIGERDFLHEIPMPKAVGMVSLIKPPCRGGWCGCEEIGCCLKPFSFVALEGGRADIDSLAVP